MEQEYKKHQLDNYLFEDIYKLDDEKSKIVAINFKGVKYTYKEIEKSVDYYCHKLVEAGVQKVTMLVFLV